MGKRPYRVFKSVAFGGRKDASPVVLSATEKGIQPCPLGLHESSDPICGIVGDDLLKMDGWSGEDSYLRSLTRFAGCDRWTLQPGPGGLLECMGKLKDPEVVPMATDNLDTNR